MKNILVETSARHAHVTQETLEVLFGAGYQLEIRKMLSQPGQYASTAKIKVVGPKGELTCTILGPTRKADQVEISLTDARSIGLTALIRESGVIAAKRHIHMTPADAVELGVSDKEIVSVLVKSADRTTTFGDVVVRVHDSFALAMHIDTDESNAAGLSGEVYGTIVK